MAISKKRLAEIAKPYGGLIGRPALEARFKKRRVTVSLQPAANAAWLKLGRNAGCSKGQLAAWLALSPEAEEARKLAVKTARFFIPPG